MMTLSVALVGVLVALKGIVALSTFYFRLRRAAEKILRLVANFLANQAATLLIHFFIIFNNISLREVVF